MLGSDSFKCNIASIGISACVIVVVVVVDDDVIVVLDVVVVVGRRWLALTWQKLASCDTCQASLVVDVGCWLHAVSFSSLNVNGHTIVLRVLLFTDVLFDFVLERWRQLGSEPFV